MEKIDFGLSEIFGEGNNKLTAAVTIKADVNGVVSIDGSDVAFVKPGEPYQIECGLGQHIIKVSSEKHPEISKEIIQDIETPGRNYLLIVDGLAPLVAKTEKSSKSGFFSGLFGGKSKDDKPSKDTLKLKLYCDTETGELLKKLEPLEVGTEIPKIKEMADNGDMAAQYVLGLLLKKGFGCKFDAVTAYQYFIQSSDQGFPFAMCARALMSINPNDFFYDPDTAINLAYKATKLDCKPAFLALGKAYDIKGETIEAIKWFETAAKNGSAEACEILGNMYLKGESVPRDPQKALSWYEKGMKRGSLACMRSAGFRYAYGDGASQNFSLAQTHFLKPAEHGDISAQWGLGYCYYKQNNAREAFNWLSKAAEAGHSNAQYYLGTLYTMHLDGIPHDSKMAFYWLDKAALNGNQDAFNYVQRLYGLYEEYMPLPVRNQYRYQKKRH